jgi:hypothetical protein
MTGLKGGIATGGKCDDVIMWKMWKMIDYNLEPGKFCNNAGALKRNRLLPGHPCTER